MLHRFLKATSRVMKVLRALKGVYRPSCFYREMMLLALGLPAKLLGDPCLRSEGLRLQVAKMRSSIPTSPGFSASFFFFF